MRSKTSNSIWNNEELLEEWQESIIVPIYNKEVKRTLVIVEAYHFVNLVQNFIQHPAVKDNAIAEEIVGDH